MDSATPIPVSYDEFLRRLRESQLLSNEQIDSALARFEASCSERSRAKDPARALAKWLVRSETLTLWQVRHLRSGSKRPMVLGSYRLLTHLGSGGMSQVYLAEHKKMHRQVAIKILPESRVADKSYLKRFQREARAVAQLDHPNIVRAFGFDEQGTTHYLIMEYVAGPDLDRLVRKGQPLSVEQTLDYLRQTLHGLAHAHSKGMVHRDIKPANLLIDPQGTLKILDFGLARLETAKAEPSVTVELNENTIGTADYMAPEQAVDSHNADARADFYSLGCTLYFLLTGREPFGTGTIAQRLVKHQCEEPTPETAFRNDVPAWLIAIRKRLMAKKPADRYQDAEAILHALDTKTAGSPPPLALPIGLQATGSPGIEFPAEIAVVRPLETRLSVRSRKRSSSLPWVSFSIGGGVIVLGMLLAMMLGGSPTSPNTTPTASKAPPSTSTPVMPPQQASSLQAVPSAQPGLMSGSQPDFHWQLTADRIVDRQVQPLHGELGAAVQLNLNFQQTSPRALLFRSADSSHKAVIISKDLSGVTLPKRQITVEAWVCVDKPRPWGGIIGVPRFGSEPHCGWLLGYRDQNFCFRLATKSADTIGEAIGTQEFLPRRWYHVVGVYDGESLSVFVNGRLDSTVQTRSGEIRYPETAEFVLGALSDLENFTALSGAIYSASIWSRALDETTVRQRYETQLRLEPALANSGSRP